MNVRSPAVLLALFLVGVFSSPATGDIPAGEPVVVDTRDAPRSPDRDGTWIDLERQQVRDGGAVVRLSTPLVGTVQYLEARAVAGGHLIAVWRERDDGEGVVDLVHIRPDGEHHAIAEAIGDDSSWAVDPTGSRVAYVRSPPEGPYSVVVADAASGDVFGEVALPARPQVFGYDGRTVWISRRTDAGVRRAPLTWDTTTGALEPLPERLRFALEISFEAGAVAGPAGQRWRVAPVSPRANWDAWTVKTGQVALAPGGRHLMAVDRNYEETYPIGASIRRVRTGKAIRRFEGPIWGPVTWQNPRRAVVRVYATSTRYAWLRLDRDGRVRRVSRFVEGFGPSIVPVQRP